ncbi:MAG: sugar nucleotide-binding protein [Flavobacteriaceae bacterium]|nr:sugar nucleotide-binding protein [Flavobacteriaceae bacterium]
MKRVLILGASGFIGNTLYKELNSYYDTFGTYFTKKGFGNNHHFFHFDMEEGGLEIIIKEVKPKLIISALRGPFEALIETHQFLINLIDRSNCRLIFLSSANVFDTFEHFPSYEYDKTLSESIYGRFKIKIENDLLRLSPSKFVLARLPMVFGNQSPRIQEIDQAINQNKPIEVFPNTIINVNNDIKLSQQIHYIINQQLTGVFHLGSTDLIHHFDFIKLLIQKRYQKTAVYKQVYTTNQMRYLAVLSKENKLPPNLLFSYTEILDDLTPVKKDF